MLSSWVIVSLATSWPAAFLTTSTGTISSLNLPMRVAMNAFLWLLTANWSCASRVMLYCSARFSAVAPMIRLQVGSVRPSHSPSVSSACRIFSPQRAPLMM